MKRARYSKLHGTTVPIRYAIVLTWATFLVGVMMGP